MGLPSVTPLKVEKASFKDWSSVPGDRPGAKIIQSVYNKREKIYKQ